MTSCSLQLSARPGTLLLTGEGWRREGAQEEAEDGRGGGRDLLLGWDAAAGRAAL